MANKKRDDEKLITLIVCGLFSVVLLIVLFTAGNLFHMGILLSAIAVTGIAATAFAWYKVLTNLYDPNYDYWRLLCIVFALATIITIMGHRASWLDKKQVKIDSAIEQARP
jgi:hypothetical protein